MAERLVIKISDSTVERREVRGQRGTFTSESQHGVAELPNGERRIVRVRVPRGESGYPVGLYAISDKSFGVGQYGDIEVQQVYLVPVGGAAAPGGPGPSGGGQR